MLYREVELDVLQSMAMRVINARATTTSGERERKGNVSRFIRGRT